MKQRINKYLAEAGYCSRRRADELIKAGQVFINGVKAELGSRVEENDEVGVKGQKIKKIKDQKIYLAYHKPVGVICTADQSKKDNMKKTLIKSLLFISILILQLFKRITNLTMNFSPKPVFCYFYGRIPYSDRF